MAGLFLCPIIAAVMRCMGLYCVRGIEEYTPLILCPLWGVLLCCGLYALQAVPMRGAFGSPSSPYGVAVV
nr:MAG TPA: hypothetical protein [Caudoviricetes sp.]